MVNFLVAEAHEDGIRCKLGGIGPDEWCFKKLEGAVGAVVAEGVADSLEVAFEEAHVVVSEEKALAGIGFQFFGEQGIGAHEEGISVEDIHQERALVAAAGSEEEAGFFVVADGIALDGEIGAGILPVDVAEGVSEAVGFVKVDEVGFEDLGGIADLASAAGAEGFLATIVDDFIGIDFFEAIFEVGIPFEEGFIGFLVVLDEIAGGAAFAFFEPGIPLEGIDIEAAVVANGIGGSLLGAFGELGVAVELGEIGLGVVEAAFGIDFRFGGSDDGGAEEVGGFVGGIKFQGIRFEGKFGIGDFDFIAEEDFLLFDEIVSFFAAEAALAVGEDGSVEVGGYFGVEVVAELVGKQLLGAIDQDDIAEEFGFAGIAMIDERIGENDGGIALLDDDVALGEYPLVIFDEGGIAVHEDAILVELDLAG